MRKFIKAVAVTGADDSIRPEELVSIEADFPFVEFGILLSKKQQGIKRFPSRDWLEELYLLWRNKKLTLSGHLCGKWVRDLCLGGPSFFMEMGYIERMFQRLQLNFHAERHTVDAEKLSKSLKQWAINRPIIFQMDGVNQDIFYSMYGSMYGGWGIYVYPLYDLSGGAGLLPDERPVQAGSMYRGYVSEFPPRSFEKQLEKISTLTSGLIWIDMGKALRSRNNRLFDLEKVRQFLKIAEPWTLSAER